jgi:hypothetical protein
LAQKQFRLISSENFIEKTTIKGYQIAQKSVISFKKHQLGCLRVYKTKKTRLVILDLVKSVGTSFSCWRETITKNGEVSFSRINLMGMNFLLLVFKCSKVFKQTDITKLLLQKKITQFLDVILSTKGKKKNQDKPISYRNLQLRAFF